ncbi:DASH complex, subunit Duo1 [Penicillium expansum]|nr:DASH complex, subunit Duo1 [Penicillium expansum]KGO64262.1 DASH complex, subunit Duo1 [Penicillium expansum]
MAFRTTAEEMERLQLSDDETDDLWNSPSKRVSHKKIHPRTDEKTTPEPRASHDGEDPLFDHREAQEAALRAELQGVRNINEVIEGLLGSLDSAKGNMETVSQTVTSASTLLNTWTRILSQTEHNQRLILNPNWQGASQDMIDIENQAIQRQQAAERREQALQQQREVAARKAEEIEKRRAQVTRGTRGTRGTTRGTVRTTGLGRTPSVSTTRTATRGSTTTTQRPASGIARGSGISRGRGKV